MNSSWENYKPNWYKATINISSHKHFEEILQWIGDNIQGYRKHIVWRKTGDEKFEIRFRFDKDYSLFILRWG